MAHRPKHQRAALLRRALSGRMIKSDVDPVFGGASPNYQIARLKMRGHEGFVDGQPSLRQRPVRRKSKSGA